MSYDSASRPQTLTYTNSSGDTDQWLWDANSGNIAKATFTVGGTTDTHTYTWNPNGTLQKLVVADNLSSADNQTCTTSDDDIGRLTSWNCGSLYNESYAYSNDAFGNITKSGSLSFNPGYTSLTSCVTNHNCNQLSSGFGATYDSDGNILHDPTSSINYTWDAYGQMISQGGNSIIDNGLGQIVEQDIGSNKYYYVQTPIGQVGTATGLRDCAKITIHS